MYEQTYKISETEIAGEDDIEEMLGDSFLEKVLERFKQMNNDFELVLDSLD